MLQEKLVFYTKNCQMSFNLLIPYLWNPSLNLKKETSKSWKCLEVKLHRHSAKEDLVYLYSSIKNRADGRLDKVINFNQLGELSSVLQVEYPDGNTEITKLINARKIETKDIKKFNEFGFLIEHVEESPFGGFEQTKYHYDEDNRLIKIFKKEDEEETWETFIYKEDKLFKIETENNDSGSLFRGFIYDKNGLLEKMIRMQNNLVNLEVKYIYNDQAQKIAEIHESVNRLGTGKNSLMTTAYTYHSNGQLKTECFKCMDSYKGKTKSESIEHYDENGLLLKITETDFLKETEENFIYEYQFFE